MATHARQQYFADESSLSKERREFSIADEIQEKIDSVEEGAQVNKIEAVKVNGTALVPDANKAVNVEVPDVIDNLYTITADDALSAKQGKILYDYIQNLQTIGRFLSNWDTATGLPITNPSESPYLYKAGDYYRVSNVATSPATNYKPNGSSYTIGVASTTIESLPVAVSDLYLYDGTDWILLSNSGSAIAIDSSLSTTSTNPVENRVITNALNGKHPGEISNVAPSNPVEGMLWYDTVNDELKTYDGTTWQTEGTKMVVLEYGVSTWQNFIDAYNENAIVYCKVSSGSSGYRMAFMAYTAGTTVPTEVEFQYYRSRSSHSQSTTQLDEVYVYKLTNAGVWTTAQRDTGAEMIAGTGIGIAFSSSGATISNTGVTSVNGNTGAVTLDADDISDSTTTNKFVTASDKTTWNGKQDALSAGTGISLASNTVTNTQPGPVISSSAPSGPTEGMLWYDTTNDQLKVYDGSNWDIVGDDAANINTKTFYLSSTSGATALAEAQEVLDWYFAGKNPIIVYQDRVYTLYQNSISDSYLIFRCLYLYHTEDNSSSYDFVYTLNIVYSGTNIDRIFATYQSTSANYLGINIDYSSPYVPQYNGSPATKKYVDDNDTYIGSSAPSNPVEGRLWYDTTNDQLKVYDGTNWDVTGKEYTAGTGINIDANNAIANTGVLSVNGNTGAVTVAETEIVYVTQTEYNNLPSSKLTDGKHYVIYSTGAIAVTGVTLDESSISLTTVGQTYQLTATVSPNDATDKSVTWNSSDTTIATVSQSGLVTCVTPGTCTITVTTTDGGFTATCGVTGGGWQPGADTLIYLPLNSTDLLSDLSGNSNNFTNAGGLTFTTVSGVDSCNFPQTNTGYAYINSLTLGESRTMCFWRYGTTFTARNILSSDVSHGWKIGNESATDLNCDGGVIGRQTFIKSDTPPSMSGAWHYITYTFEVESASLIRYKAYMDGVLYVEMTGTSRQSMASIAGTFYLGWDCYSSSTDRFFNGNLSNFIIENKVWTATEILDYYNQTKGDYGIS